nr:MAG TPA: hypothetical protein [Caudoviricetes sp.]
MIKPFAESFKQSFEHRASILPSHSNYSVFKVHSAWEVVS